MKHTRTDKKLASLIDLQLKWKELTGKTRKEAEKEVELFGEMLFGFFQKYDLVSYRNFGTFATKLSSKNNPNIKKVTFKISSKIKGQL
ncbi:MAG: hypothetical protein LBV51_03780 [Acholeplasmatales bacterium]|jgi:nucleoid DNA-binding protein|nr:hypothetical protein [Acholeplasmatales bacterium]